MALRIRIRVSTRLVILIGDRAYKFPLGRRGYLQGKNEKKIWDQYKELGVLGDLIWERFGCVCMKRYPPASRIPQYVIRCIKELIPEFDIPRCDLNKVENWGKDEYSNPVLIDYGINEYISTLY